LRGAFPTEPAASMQQSDRKSSAAKNTQNDSFAFSSLRLFHLWLITKMTM
jgi:hypothetical protein